MEKNLTYTEMSARLHFYESHNLYQTKQLDEKEKEIKELKAELERVKELLKLALKEKYAPKSEKADIDNGQLSFYEYEETPTDAVPVQPVKAYTRKEKRTYEEIYKNLPASEIVYDLSEEEKFCDSCGKEMTFMGYDSYREIEYIPPVIKIIEHRKKKYACKSCEIIRTAKAPLPLFDHSLVSPSLLSYIINEKFCKGVPLYRLEQDLHRMGINISRQSMCSWIIAGAELLKPIYDILHKRLVEEEILHADETPFQVNKVKGRTKPVHGYMWVYRTGKYAEVPIIMYDYRNGRAGDYPVQFLKGFSGYLHCDGLRQYSYIPHVTRAGCWAHLRRYFLNAVNVQHNKNDLTTIAGQGFLRIQKIFRAEGGNSENSQKNYSYSLKEIAYIRKTKSSRLASEFFEWCEKNQGIAAPGSLIPAGKAILAGQLARLAVGIVLVLILVSMPEALLVPVCILAAVSGVVCLVSAVFTAKAVFTEKDMKKYARVRYVFSVLCNLFTTGFEGYEALNSEMLVPTLYVYLNNAADTEKIIEKIEQSYSDKIVSTMNYQKMTETTQEMYSGITSVIVIVIFVLTILIVLFVLYIVIKTLLVQRKQELGIYKAIGYSNKQLMVQMIGSFLPSSIAAVLLSSVLGLIYVPEINQFIFQTIGAMKNNMEVSFAFLMIFAFVQITANLVISILLTKPIKKISAYALIKEN